MLQFVRHCRIHAYAVRHCRIRAYAVRHCRIHAYAQRFPRISCFLPPPCSLAHRVEALFGQLRCSDVRMPKKPRWTRYKRGDANYSGKLRRALPTASGRVRKAVQAAVAADETLAIHDTSHLLVEEVIDTTTGRRRQQCRIKYFHPIRLVQFLLNNCSSLAQHYGEMAMENPDRTWRLIIGCEEQTLGSKMNKDNHCKTWSS